MDKSRLQRATPWAMAALAGALWAISFPNWNLHGAAWLAPSLILLTTLPFPQKPLAAPAPWWKRPFRLGRWQLGYVAGLTHYLISLHWLLYIPHPPGAIAGWLALSAYLAVYPALWVLACGVLARPLFSPSPTTPSNHPHRDFIEAFGRSPASQRMLWAFSCAAAWVAWEMIISRMFTGFPWNLLGASQYRNVPLIQIASITGIYGVSFIIAWFSLSLLTAACAVWARARATRSEGPILAPYPRLFEISLPLLALLILALHGFKRSMAPTQSGEPIKIALVQPSIPQTLIWDSSQNAFRFEQLMKLSREALAHKPDLLVWPEAAVPELLRHDPATAEAVRELVQEHNVHMILGADDATPKFPEARTFHDYNFYNSSFALNPAGEITGLYRKRRLVMFGEYVPFLQQLPFLKYVTPIGDAGFTPGDRPVPFELQALAARVSVLICFEDVFPHLAREYADETLDFLLNLTNNGWFGESSAQWQHAASAVFRAVENGIPLVRCSNNGLTCWVDERGRMHDVYFENDPNIYRAGYKIVSVPRLGLGQTRALTYYTRHGDVFGWTCFALTGVAIFRARSPRKVSAVSAAP